MAGKIDRDGVLWLLRNGVMKAMLCPTAADCRRCGDWCPRFGEPRGQSVTLCGETVLLGITDERRCGSGSLSTPATEGFGIGTPGFRAATGKRGPRAHKKKPDAGLRWQRVSVHELQCPKCGTVRDTSKLTRNTPRTCRGCGTKLG